MTRYEPAIDLGMIDAIDVHAHVEVDANGHVGHPQALQDAMAAYFGPHEPLALDDVAAYYRERKMAAR